MNTHNNLMLMLIYFDELSCDRVGVMDSMSPVEPEEVPCVRNHCLYIKEPEEMLIHYSFTWYFIIYFKSSCWYKCKACCCC